MPLTDLWAPCLTGGDEDGPFAAAATEHLNSLCTLVSLAVEHIDLAVAGSGGRGRRGARSQSTGRAAAEKRVWG